MNLSLADAGSITAQALTGLNEVTSPASDATAHAGATISGQLDLASIGGHHIPHTAFTTRHGWMPLIGSQVIDKHPQWLIDQEKAGRDAAAEGAQHARQAEIPHAGTRVLTPKQHAMVAFAQQHLGSMPDYAAPAAGSVPPPPAVPGTIGARLAHADPALASLAAPGTSEEAIRKYVDAQVSIKVAEQARQISARQSADLKAAVAEMHESQQKVIAAIRGQYEKTTEGDDHSVRVKLVMNQLFTVAGVGAAIAGIAGGLSPVMAAMVAALVPLVNIIHDYVRSL